MDRLLNIVLISLFLLVLLLPALDMATGLVSDPEIDENRFLAPFPALEARKSVLKAFPREFEEWFSDHLGLRGTLVGAYRSISQEWLDSADSVLVGKDGWRYLLRDTVEYPERLPLPADLCGRNPFTDAALDAWVDALVYNRESVEALGARYVSLPGTTSQAPDRAHVQVHAGGRRPGGGGVMPSRADEGSSRHQATSLSISCA